MNEERLKELVKLIRYYILTSTTEAGSGHPSSSLSAVELMVTLFFGGNFRFNLDKIDYLNNDRIIFSKGHAAPLLYSLFTAAGKIEEIELRNLRKFGCFLEGHPMPSFPFSEVASGSLGQGLSIGLGMAINAKFIDKLSYRTFVLLGDSEMSEGSIWEAIQLASYYRLDNLIGIVDFNRLGQRGETMHGLNAGGLRERISSFGWEVMVIDGHSLREIKEALGRIEKIEGKPLMIIGKTKKGKGVSFIEDKEGWHGRVLNKEEYQQALNELGEIDFSLRGEISKPEQEIVNNSFIVEKDVVKINLEKRGMISTRKAYGDALVELMPSLNNLVVLDAEVSNSTFAETFRNKYPERFFEMFIAEQNMVGAAVGLAKRGKIPFVSTFGAFLTRAFDQIRMGRYSEANIKFIGSHAGVSVGEDGVSQMALEDIAMFRTVLDSVIFYPCDAVSMKKVVFESAKYQGVVYIRTTRQNTPVLYGENEDFFVGGSKILKESENDAITIVGAGITLHESLKAYNKLKDEGVVVRIIDLYCVKPIDQEVLGRAAKETKAILVVEDHYEEGGMGEAVRSTLAGSLVPIYSLAVRKMPKSGKSEELLDYEEISSAAIIKKAKEILSVK